jgi:hypothetical protein
MTQKKEWKRVVGGVVQVVEHISSKYKALSSNPIAVKKKKKKKNGKGYVRQTLIH